MQAIFKLEFLLLSWLLCGQVQGQDIRPEFPEDFTSSTAEATTVEATTELAKTTTPTEATTELSTTTEAAAAAATTEKATIATRRTTTTKLPSFPPTYPPPVLPTTDHEDPYYPAFDKSDENLEKFCYLKTQTDQKRVRWSCGFTSWVPSVNCYRCCYFGHNSFAGCNKVYSGTCSNIVHNNWQF